MNKAERNKIEIVLSWIQHAYIEPKTAESLEDHLKIVEKMLKELIAYQSKNAGI